MGDLDVIALLDEGRGNSAYLVDLADGRAVAVAVDAGRELRGSRAADRRGLIVAFAADRHLNVDFLTGAVQLAATGGATVLASAVGDRGFAHAGLVDGVEVDLDGALSSGTGGGQWTISVPLVGAEGVGGAGVFDIRADSEFASGYVPGAEPVEFGELIAGAGDLPTGPMVLRCGRGGRALGAAGLLGRAGHGGVAVLVGGPASWVEATGGSREVSE